MFTGVLLHKVPDGLTIYSIVLVAFNDRKKAFIASLALASATIFGGALVWLLSDRFVTEVIGDSFERIGLSFSAGVFLYVAATDLIPVDNQSENRKTGLYFLLGVAVFYVASWIIAVVGVE